MRKHTEGIWNISKLATPDYAPEFGIYAGDSERDLARVMGPNAEADAQLIAAAPLMLKALEVVADMLGRHPDFNRGNTVVHYCADLARSAIPEATGD